MAVVHLTLYAAKGATSQALCGRIGPSAQRGIRSQDIIANRGGISAEDV
jgi:hypothetical protein